VFFVGFLICLSTDIFFFKQPQIHAVVSFLIVEKGIKDSVDIQAISFLSFFSATTKTTQIVKLCNVTFLTIF